MNNKRCPECGSSVVIEKKKNISVTEPFAGRDNIEILENVCSLCGSRGDFFDQNESLIDKTVKNLKQKSVENILDYFIDNKMSMSSIERALEIPQRTFTKWKNKTIRTSSAGIALLRFIRLFPWLLEVAENKYDYKKAENIQINDAIKKFLNKASYSNLQEGHRQNFESTVHKFAFNAGGTFLNNLNIENEYESFGVPRKENDEEKSFAECLSA